MRLFHVQNHLASRKQNWKNSNLLIPQIFSHHLLHIMTLSVTLSDWVARFLGPPPLLFQLLPMAISTKQPPHHGLLRGYVAHIATIRRVCSGFNVL